MHKWSISSTRVHAAMLSSMFSDISCGEPKALFQPLDNSISAVVGLSHLSVCTYLIRYSFHSPYHPHETPLNFCTSADTHSSAVHNLRRLPALHRSIPSRSVHFLDLRPCSTSATSATTASRAHATHIWHASRSTWSSRSFRVHALHDGRAHF